jgi:uncharacterized protein YkwD
VRASINVVRWLQVAAVLALTVGLVASLAPSAGAAAQTTRRHHRHHKHHRRHHKKLHANVKAAQQSRAVITQSCPNADEAAIGAGLSDMRSAVVCLINQQRGAHGLPGLKVSAKLNRSAQSWNQWMVNTGQFTHGNNFAGRISAVGYNWQTAGENIATGFTTPRQVVAAWMASPDHCRNILDPNFRDVGTGESPAAVGSWASQPATFTQDFGLLMSQNAPSRNTGPQNGCPY